MKILVSYRIFVAKLQANHFQQGRTSEQLTEMLKECLQKVCQLQADLQRSDNEQDDPEAAGYAACAAETLRFLSAEGLPPDHPVVRALAERLLCDREWNLRIYVKVTNNFQTIINILLGLGCNSKRILGNTLFLVYLVLKV